MKTLIPLLVIALSVTSYFLYISPMMLEIDDLKLQRDQYLNVLDKVKELKDQRDAALAVYNNISLDDLNRLNKIVPATFDSVKFANDVSAMAQRHGVFIKDFKTNTVATDPGAEVVPGSYKTNVVTVTFNGRFEQFIEFLRDLESSLQLVDVGEMKIISSAGQGRVASDSLTQFGMELYTYSLR
jgi:Tfp pilus assembly protein PilO